MNTFNPSKKITFFFIGILLLLQHQNILACSCAFVPDTFCESVTLDYNPNILNVTVINKYNLLIDGSWYAPVMDIVINEQIFGEDSFPDTLSIFGQDGLNCSEEIGWFQVSEKFILSISPIQSVPYPDQAETAPYESYNLFGCGRFYLEISSEGNVTGPISPGVNVLSMDDYMLSLNDCLLLSDIDDLPEESQITVSPNPVSGSFLRIASDVDHEIIYQVISQLGTPITEGKIDAKSEKNLPVEQLPAGVYFLAVVQQGERKIMERFIKL